jgi:hypothetical protein
VTLGAFRLGEIERAQNYSLKFSEAFLSRETTTLLVAYIEAVRTLRSVCEKDARLRRSPELRELQEALSAVSWMEAMISAVSCRRDACLTFYQLGSVARLLKAGSALANRLTRRCWE